MILSSYIPTRRGWLALAIGFTDGVVMSFLIPVVSGRPHGILNWGLAAFLALLTAILCIRSFHKSRIPDRLAALVSGGFAAWIFYVYLHFELSPAA
jgi:hypothetical protein